MAERGVPVALTVGRYAELDTLRRLLADSRHGPQRLVLDGEPGVGKSSLVRAAIRLARGRGHQVLACDGSLAEAQWAYAGLIDLLGDTELADCPLTDPQRHALRVALGQEPPGGGVAAGLVASATLAAVRWLAGRGPLLLAIDDQPWLDASTSAALDFVNRRLADLPVALLAARRSDAPAPPAYLLDAPRLHLGPMGPAELHELILTRLHRRLDRSTLAKVHTASGGNPMFALEFAHGLDHRARSAGDPLPVPETLVGLVSERLARVPDAARPLLYAAAVAAAPSVARLRQLFAEPIDDALESAEAAGVLRIVDDRLDFTHPLLACTVLDQTPQSVRRVVHRRLAAVEREPEARARHLALATIGAAEPVAAALEEAATRASEYGATAGSVADLLRLAQARTPEDLSAAWARRTLRLADALLNAGDLAAAGREYDAAIAHPAVPDRARALSGRSAVCWYQGRPGAASRFAAAGLAHTTEPALVGELHGRLAVYSVRDWRRSRKHATAAVRALEQAEEPDLLAAALCNLFIAQVYTGQVPRPQLLDRALACENPAGSVDQSTMPGVWYLALDRWDDARKRFTTLLRRDRCRGDLSSEPLLLAHLAEVELAAGDWPAARRRAAEAERSARLSGAGFRPARTRAHLDAYRGNHERARAAAGPQLAAAERAGDRVGAAGWLAVLTAVAAAERDHAAVRELTARTADHLTAAGIVEPLLRRDPAPDRAIALAELGATTEAADVLDDMERRQRRIPRPWLAAAIARARGLLLATAGDLDAALTAVGSAPASSPFDNAQNLLVRGRLLRRARRSVAADDTLCRAEQIFVRLGATAWAANARTERDRLGRHRPGGTQLTPTERQVAELAAAGGTNRQTAEALSMSPKTVEAHLSRIYRKLGINSRAELGRRIPG